MSRPAQTELALLGALSIEPMTGYAVRAAITETLGHFWAESFGQIYPTLARLEDAGLVERGEAGKTSGRTYRVTAAGRERLTHILQQPIPPSPPRNGTLLRLFFGEHLGLGVCRELLVEAGERARTQLTLLAGIHAELQTELAHDPGARYRLVTVLAGEHAARAQLAWVEESLALLAS